MNKRSWGMKGGMKREQQRRRKGTPLKKEVRLKWNRHCTAALQPRGRVEDGLNRLGGRPLVLQAHTPPAEATGGVSLSTPFLPEKLGSGRPARDRSGEEYIREHLR